MMQDLGSASDWLKQISQVAQHNQYIRSTTQIWYLVMRHQHGISVLVSQMSIWGETSGGVTKCCLFSQTSIFGFLHERIMIRSTLSFFTKVS